MVRLLKEEILETFNQKINTIQTQVQQLHQAHQTQMQIQNPTMIRPQIQVPQQQMRFPPLQIYHQ